MRSAETLCLALEGADAVVHLAAIVGDPACSKQPTLAHEVNQEASLAVFQSSQKVGVPRFVFASTCSNYGKMPEASSNLTEEAELAPVSLYAKTKVFVERALLSGAVGNSSIVTVVRFATLYGISPRMRFDLTVNEFAAEMFHRRKLILYGEQFWRPYVHVSDAARAVGMILRAPPETVADQVFNVGDTKENYQKGELVRLIQERIAESVEITRVARDEDPRDYAVSFEKLKEVIGFSITRTVESGIEEVLDALRQGLFIDCQDPRYRNC